MKNMNTHGFHLIELLIVITLAAIITTFALSWRNILIRTQDEIVLSELIQTIQTAQTEAQARGAPIVLCQSQNHLTCSGNWYDGQIIFINENKDGKVDDANNILSVVQPTVKQGKLYMRSFPHYRNYLLFLPGNHLEQDNSTFWYCNTSQEKPSWALVINKSGRVKSIYPDKFGIIRDAKGKQVLCGLHN